MTTTELTRASETSSRADFLLAPRSYLRGRPGIIAAGAAIAVAGLVFNWGFLVASGIAPLLLSILPCVAMCALGLCMNRMMGRSCSTENVTDQQGADSPKSPSADMKGNG